MSLESQTLILSAQRWMNAGLEKFVSDDGSGFAVHHFGVATEHLLKAYLSSLHPALIIDGNDFDSLLHATGHGTSAKVPLSGVKSIMAVEAFTRCKNLLKAALPIEIAAFRLLLNARNGVSHIGHHDSDRARQLLLVAIRVTDPLLEALGIPLPTFWGDFHALRAELILIRADELKVRYESKVADARMRLATRLGDFTLPDFARIASEITYRGESEPATCPVCGSEGWLSGDLYPGEVGTGNEYSAEARTNDWVVILYPWMFDCRVCGLTLGKDEFRLAGLPLEVKTKHDPDLWGPADEERDRE